MSSSTNNDLNSFIIKKSDFQSKDKLDSNISEPKSKIQDEIELGFKLYHDNLGSSAAKFLSGL